MTLVGCARIGGARRRAALELELRVGHGTGEGADAIDLGFVPLLVRPLRLSFAARGLKVPPALREALPGLALVAPFGGRPAAAVREIAVPEPRVTRLWERFCVDVGAAVERDASFVNDRVLLRTGEGYRVLILEDGDRYAIRAMCIFRVGKEPRGGAATGYVMELLHDRSVAGMRAASHLLALAVREMAAAGAESARAWSLPHSGSFPIFARHAFLPVPARFLDDEPRVTVRAVDPELEDLVARRDRWYLSYLDTLV